MLFRLDDVWKSFGAEEVLRGITFQINPADRAALVGRNGAGKTTILRLITGGLEPDRGAVFLAKGLRVGLLEQRPTFARTASVRDEALSVFSEIREVEDRMADLEHRMTEEKGSELEEVMETYSDLRHRYDFMGGFSYHSRAEGVLLGLGFARGELQQAAEQLSGGQRSRLALAKLLLSEPDLLLLDEPTNHLDVDALEWLEGFLSSYRSAFLVISHDRYLLDRITAKTVEIDKGRATVYRGNYSSYLQQREERALLQSRQFEQQQELISRTEEFIRRNIAGQKTRQAKSRRNMLDRLERVEAVRTERVGNFTAGSLERTGDIVLQTSDLKIGYDATPIVDKISVLVRRHDRVGIIGSNGSGKTTFLKTILGGTPSLGGTLTWGTKVKIGYLDQELAGLDPRSTPLQELSTVVAGLGEGELRGYLARFLFTNDDAFKQLAVLSGGELARLALAKLTYGESNVLVLDEPTNHLDIPSREALENSLAEYAGTIIAVSHDRFFLDRIATGILHFEEGQATYHQGTFSEYYELKRRSESSQESETTLQPRRTNLQTPRRKDETRGREPREIEGEIACLEQELADISSRLSNPRSEWGPEEYSEIAARHLALSSQLEQLYREWDAVLSNKQE